MREESAISLPLPRAFYAQPTVEVARALIGKTLTRRTTEGLVAGIIVETEAYVSASDPAAHGYSGKTARNAAMFGPPGHAYVYVSYGMHHCLNVVTEAEGTGAAVLVRALEPVHGVALMRRWRGEGMADRDLCRGPGRLCQALGISLAENEADLRGDALWLSETAGMTIPVMLAASPRIGISRATDLPWRFYLPGSRYVSGRPAR